MNILFLSRWFPYPPDNGSRIRIYNLIKVLSTRHQITLISFTSEAIPQHHLDALQPYCCHVKTVPYRPFRPQGLKALLGYFSLQPRSIIDTYNVDMETAVQQAARNHKFNLVIATQSDMATYAAALPRMLPKILEELELTVIYEQYAQATQQLKKLHKRLTWWKLTRHTTHILSHFKGCTVVSKAEKELVTKATAGYAPIEVIPNGVDTTYHQPGLAKPQPDSLVYSGALTYQANFDAVDFFLDQIYPLIQAERPGVTLAITGKLNGVPVETLPQRSNVTFTGYLDDIRPKIAESWINIVPLRIGGGTRLKILESLALGTPVVTTSKGVEGLDLLPEQEILVADTPADFAAAVLRLLKEPDLRASLSRNGRRAVEARYDWQTIGQQLDNFIKLAI